MGSVCSSLDDIRQPGAEVAGVGTNKSSVEVKSYSSGNVVLGNPDSDRGPPKPTASQGNVESPPEKDRETGERSNDDVDVAIISEETTKLLSESDNTARQDIDKPSLGNNDGDNLDKYGVNTNVNNSSIKPTMESTIDDQEVSNNDIKVKNTDSLVSVDAVPEERPLAVPEERPLALAEERPPLAVPVERPSPTVGFSDAVTAMSQDADNDSGLDGEDMDDIAVDVDDMEFLDDSLGDLDGPAKMASIGELAITKPAPDFECNAVVNGSFETVKLSSYRGKYVVLFFYPLDFTFVCPTEIIAFSDRAEEFRAINCEILACSTDSVYSHLAWIDTPRKQGGLGPMKIPLLADRTQEISKKYGCLKPDEGIAFRGLYIIDDKGNLRQVTINDLPVGRSVDETLRLVQAFQFTDKHGEVCPAGWKPGKETMKPNPKESQKFFAKS